MSFGACALLAFVCSTHADFSFLTIGDWGGGSDEQPTTESQELTAAGMQKVAQDLGINFTLLAGDNFYVHGVACNADSSSRFRETFHEVYAKKMPQTPFYVLAGNHDYGQDHQANVSSQLAYSNLDSQWHFPALWHKVHREFTVDTHARTLDLLVIDTVILCGNGGGNEIFIDNQLRPMWPSLAKLPPRELRQAIAEEQWAWLEQQLSASTADFLWVSGHYPVYSAGYDGSQQCLIDRLLPMLRKYNAHYVSGHDHMSEHVQHGNTNLFVIGAGKECCYPPANLNSIPSGALKYMLGGYQGDQSSINPGFPVYGSFGSFRFTAEHAHVTMHAHNGDVLYEAPPILRRGQREEMQKASSIGLWMQLTFARQWVQSHMVLAYLSGLICLGSVSYPVIKRRSRRTALKEVLLEH
mmetsp:Transcript_129845/g.242825  ORF Transcript_129845/g.242825 Transcript_129845/m.242825 type:complete len:411 (-) Transcript_129845:54-1286(-)